MVGRKEGIERGIGKQTGREAGLAGTIQIYDSVLLSGRL